MHVSISMRVWLHRRTDRRCGPAAHTRPCAASVRTRVCACAIGRASIHADTCARLPSAWTACASAGRRSALISARHRRSTRTSARGTPQMCRICRLYAPPFRPGRDALGGSSMRRGPLCAAATADARSRVGVHRRLGTRMRGRQRV